MMTAGTPCRFHSRCSFLRASQLAGNEQNAEHWRPSEVSCYI